jgi:hypothetical protein
MVVRRVVLALPFLPIVLLLIAPPLGAQSPAAGRALATYVFVGTVPSPGGDRTGGDSGILVTVDEIYFQKGTFEDQTGRQVEVLGATPLREGSRYVLYTEPVRFGDRVTVRLIDAAGAESRQQGAATKQEVSEAFVRHEIEQRAALAELVVVGTVSTVGPLERARAPESEHDPAFYVARVKVDRALKGRPPSGEVEFAFAMSRDVQWYRSPKFRPGERGVFILQRPEPEVARLGVERQRYAILNQADFRPAAQIPLAEAALKEVR